MLEQKMLEMADDYAMAAYAARSAVAAKQCKARSELIDSFAALADMLREARDIIDTLPGYPKGAELCDKIDAICGPNAARA